MLYCLVSFITCLTLDVLLARIFLNIIFEQRCIDGNHFAVYYQCGRLIILISIHVYYVLLGCFESHDKAHDKSSKDRHHHSFSDSSKMESSSFTAGQSVQCGKLPMCKCCGTDVYYDSYMQTFLDYCSGKCRDHDLLEDNVKETREEILNLEELLLAVGKPELPRPTSGHDCSKKSYMDRSIFPLTISSSSKRSSSSSTATPVAMSSDSVKDVKTGIKPNSTRPKSYSGAVAKTKGDDIKFDV